MQVHEQINQNPDAIDLMINMGPQHPSTHGVFRLVLWIDGERIVKSEPHIGYLHRGSEKICESEHYNQVLTLHEETFKAIKSKDEKKILRAIDRHLRPLEKVVRSRKS